MKLLGDVITFEYITVLVPINFMLFHLFLLFDKTKFRLFMINTAKEYLIELINQRLYPFPFLYLIDDFHLDFYSIRRFDYFVFDMQHVDTLVTQYYRFIEATRKIFNYYLSIDCLHVIIFICQQLTVDACEYWLFNAYKALIKIRCMNLLLCLLFILQH